ncbi:MAG: PQQ-binding-like beta-propeller repeat protein, partial [Rickettsiales bacterium]|nr:PQQ-binding-like beta-propeller repeat protein [Rickettsiales bacterium]
SDGRIVAAFPNGEVHMVMDGAPIWLASTARSDFKSVNAMSDIVANPVIEGGVAIVKNYGGRTVAFDLKEGRELWTRPSGGMATPTASGGFLFDVDSNDAASASDVKTGKTIWSTKLEPEKGALAFAPLLVNNQLLVAFSSGELMKLDPYTGKLTSSDDIAPQIDMPPIVAGDALVVISNGNLEIFR